ncbi:hypothetical protein KC345_g10797, partial [Hortaea werneckii]
GVKGLATQRGHLLKRNYIFAFLILTAGFGGLLGYDLYFKPYVLSQTVVKIKVGDGGFVPKNYELKSGDLYLDSVQTKDIPAGVIRSIDQVEHKITNVNLTDGSILTESLIDVNNLEPKQDEGIFPIPKEAIYAINGSLRSRDKVDIYLVEGDSPAKDRTGGYSPAAEGASAASTSGGLAVSGQAAAAEEERAPAIPVRKVFLSGVTVNYVRTEDNNDVLDSENGNNNNRFTSTGKVAVPELKLRKSDGELLGQYLEQGMKLWIVRVELAGFTVTAQSVLPEPVHAERQLLMLTSEQVPVAGLSELRRSYPDSSILYLYLQKGIRGYQAVHMQCESLGIFFMPPRSTSSAIIDKLHFILEDEREERGNLIGFFGSGPGIGCTSAAKLFARRIASTGLRVIVLGLDLYDPGYDRKPPVSLDGLRPRITGKMLHDLDFDGFVKQEGYFYLPGNFDFLSAQDYQEEEIEYLLARASECADVVVADFGSIPESAAWYVGMQKSVLRMIVTHPRHEYRLQPLMELAGHMDLHPPYFQWIINRSNVEEMTSPKNLALRFGSEIMLELPYYQPFLESMPLGKKELQQVDDKVHAMMVSLGLAPEARKKGIFQ